MRKVDKNIYQPIRCVVEENLIESPTINTVVLKPETPFSFQAGQFASLTVPGIGEAPFTPSSSPFEKKKLEFTVMRVGRVTEKIHQLKKGDVVGVRGPYGKPYPLDLFKDKELLLVGGGVGLAPLRALFLALYETRDNYKSVCFCCGARTPEDYLYKDQLFGPWQSLCEKFTFRIAADKAGPEWKHRVGVVTTLLDDLPLNVKNSLAVVCGPPVMMKFATLKLLELKYPEDGIYLSMERKMYCAVGHCRHCLVGDLFVCKDGPVFTYSQVKNKPNVWV